MGRQAAPTFKARNATLASSPNVLTGLPIAIIFAMVPLIRDTIEDLRTVFQK